LFKHALKNAMLPILTNLVLSIPFLIMGNLLLEQFFAIPGLGDYTLRAIQGPDFAVVRAMVFLGSVIYIFGLICVDISYTLVDPRVRLK
jgi:peptide/nickel transport system permease protein